MKKLKLQELNRLSVEEYQQQNKHNIIVVVDNVRSAMNIGSIFRTADAFLVKEVLLVGISATPPNREIQKTALGATESVAWNYFESIATCIEYLEKNNYVIICVEQSNSAIPLHNLDFLSDTNYAIVLGNEVDGVSQEFMDTCNYCVEIPQFGTKHSLNVAVCAGIVLWQIIQHKIS